MKIRLSSSWQYVSPEFRDELKDMLASAENLAPDGNIPVLWQTRNKFVLLLELPSGRKVVFKAPARIKNFLKYCLRPSPWGKEASNFYRIRQMGIPTVHFLAAGEFRRFFKLRKGFLITEFAEGFSDGFDFVPGGALADEPVLVRKFVEQNFRLLAILHNNCFAHNGFTPANMLYRKHTGAGDGDSPLEILWIDLASCSRISLPWNSCRRFAQDMVHFFSYFNFTDDEKRHYLEIYCRESRCPGMTPEKLLKLVKSIRPRR